MTCPARVSIPQPMWGQQIEAATSTGNHVGWQIGGRQHKKKKASREAREERVWVGKALREPKLKGSQRPQTETRGRQSQGRQDKTRQDKPRLNAWSQTEHVAAKAKAYKYARAVWTRAFAGTDTCIWSDSGSAEAQPRPVPAPTSLQPLLHETKAWIRHGYTPGTLQAHGRHTGGTRE